MSDKRNFDQVDFRKQYYFFWPKPHGNIRMANITQFKLDIYILSYSVAFIIV